MFLTAAAALAAALGPRRAPLIYQKCARLAWKVMPARDNVRGNLRYFGLSEEYAPAIMGNFGRYLGEFFSCDGRPERYRALLGETDFSLIAGLRARGRGVLLVTPHYGNWELGALALADRFGGIDVVARRTHDPQLDRRIARARGDNRLLHVDESLRRLSRLLTQSIVAVAIDEPRDEGEKVDFFAQKIFYPSGLFRMAHRARAAIVPTLCKRTAAGRIVLEFAPPVETAQEVAAQFQIWIARDPSQWIMLNPYIPRVMVTARNV